MRDQSVKRKLMELLQAFQSRSDVQVKFEISSKHVANCAVRISSDSWKFD